MKNTNLKARAKAMAESWRRNGYLDQERLILELLEEIEHTETMLSDRVMERNAMGEKIIGLESEIAKRESERRDNVKTIMALSMPNGYPDRATSHRAATENAILHITQGLAKITEGLNDIVTNKAEG